MNNTPKLNSFYRLPDGELVKFTAWETCNDVSRFTFTSARFGCGRILTVFHTAEAKEKADSVRADFIRKRFPIDTEEKILEATIANKVEDADSIAIWGADKAMIEQSVADFYKRNPQLNHD